FLDKRTAERYLRSGQLDDKAYERYIKGLPDVAEKAATVETAIDDVDTDADDDYEDEGEDEADEAEDSAEDTQAP
ncbi:MAG TPA: RNA polymerase subunit sigma, partial [Myxococcaceae bacterium]